MHVLKSGKLLRKGYTTGSCATAAACAGVMTLLNGGLEEEFVKITLPNGENVQFQIEYATVSSDMTRCFVIKDAGDDPDVTDGCAIFAECTLQGENIDITGGVGVGKVTVNGLKTPIGSYAINPIPLKMIKENVQQICDKYGYTGGVKIVISVPNGAEVAKKTFNSRLGIEGGISILGTTGIVEPMSERAIIDTIKLEIDRKKAINPDILLIAPGNYGREFCKAVLRFDLDDAVKFSNYIGETLDYIAYKQFKRVLIVGHIGKLVKVAGGVMNTHSSNADCRGEIFAANAALHGASSAVIQAIMTAKNTDQMIAIIQVAGIFDVVMRSIMAKILEHINYRCKSLLEVGVIIFSGENELIASSDDVEKLLNEIKKRSSNK